MNKKDKKKILAAMRVIAEVCSQCHTTCEDCPFRLQCDVLEKNGYYLPADWEFKKKGDNADA